MEKQTVLKILQVLDEQYPFDIYCYLDYESPIQLLIATILSAQCTDNRVNIVTKSLFKKYKSIHDFANADLTELEEDIKSTGFYRNKSKNIKNCCNVLIENYNGVVPSEIDELIKLPGVGRKTANVVRSHIFNIPSIVVDTHVKRVSMRLGFTKNKDPDKIEFDLYKILPEEHWMRYNTQIIAHGRAVCKAPRPRCMECCFIEYCGFMKK